MANNFFKNKNLLMILIIALIVFLLPQNNERVGSIILLTVSKLNGSLTGGTASITLLIKPGSGRVFIDTFPATQLDTQISTRFAKEVACNFVNKDCSYYDFFYIIRADSSIVGGPSAGGAISALTAALLDGKSVRSDVAMTGTINAGGIIGAVGGLKQKILAAQDAGLKEVVIPKWDFDYDDLFFNNSRNLSHDGVSDHNDSMNHSIGDNRIPPGFKDELLSDDFLNNLSIRVIRVSRLDEALTVITGNNFSRFNDDVKKPRSYELLMSSVADKICERARLIEDQLPESLKSFNVSLYNYSKFFEKNAFKAKSEGNYYSQASYCFSAGLKLRQLQLSNFSDDKLRELKNKVLKSIVKKKEEIMNKSYDSLSDLQTTGIVVSRLEEAYDILTRSDNISSSSIAYAVERYNSAVAWSSFYSLPSKKVLVSNNLKRACEVKLGEAEEREDYLRIMLGNYLFSRNDLLLRARDYYSNGDFALCLFTASKAKAEIDAVISSLTVPESDYKDFVNEKLLIANRIISREAGEGRFPLMGYSYFEYARSLLDDDPYTASLFASYSLELSDLRNYFPPENNFFEKIRIRVLSDFFRGFLIGGLVLILIILYNAKGVEKKHGSNSKKKNKNK